MTRGAKIVVFSVVGLFVLAGIYYGFLAPSNPADPMADSSPTVSETPTLTIVAATQGGLGATPTGALGSTSGAGKAFPDLTGADLSGTTPLPMIGDPAFAPSTGSPVGSSTGVTPVTATASTSKLNPLESTTPSKGWDVKAAATPTPTPVPPVKSVMSTPKVTYSTYTVKAGDTLSAISGEWFKDTSRWNEIVAVNQGLSASNLRVGQKLNLPAKSGSTSTKAVTKATVKPSISTPTGSNEHVVVSGETLGSIADKAYGNRANWRRIYEANKSVIGDNPSALKVGMKLTIPAKQS